MNKFARLFSESKLLKEERTNVCEGEQREGSISKGLKRRKERHQNHFASPSFRILWAATKEDLTKSG